MTSNNRIETLKEHCLIDSLTKDNLNMLTWSHYADKQSKTNLSMSLFIDKAVQGMRVA